MEPSISRFPTFAYAGDALAWDELKKRGEKIGYGENIEPYRGFLHNNQDVPPNQNWMVTYRTVIQSNFSRASGPLAVLSLGAFRQLPAEIIQEVCYHLSFKEKIALIKALPGLEHFIRDTMKYDSPQTTYRIPREPKNNQYRPGLTEESIIFELSSDHPRTAHKGQRYHIEAEVDASFWQNFCGGYLQNFVT